MNNGIDRLFKCTVGQRLVFMYSEIQRDQFFLQNGIYMHIGIEPRKVVFMHSGKDRLVYMHSEIEWLVLMRIVNYMVQSARMISYGGKCAGKIDKTKVYFGNKGFKKNYRHNLFILTEIWYQVDNVRSLSACRELCLNARSFPCRSVFIF